MNDNDTKDNQSPEGFIGKAEVARRTAKTVRTIDSWMRSGKVPFIKIGRCVLFRWPDVERHIVENFQVIKRHKPGNSTAGYR